MVIRAGAVFDAAGLAIITVGITVMTALLGLR
jgi:hypothetical protein